MILNAPVHFSPFSHFHDLSKQNTNRKNQNKTPESSTFEHVTGVGATCCAMVSMDEAASSATNPTHSQEHLHHGIFHIATGIAEIVMTVIAGYFSLGGVVIADQIARDNATKQKSLEEAKTKISNYEPEKNSNQKETQLHAKKAFTEVLGTRSKRAKFERFVNGRWSQINSSLILKGQFIPPAQTAGLYSLAGASFANTGESMRERTSSQAGMKRAQETSYRDMDDSLVREKSFRKKSRMLKKNAFSMFLLGAGATVIASVDAALKLLPAGAGVLPGVGTLFGLPALLGGVAGTMVFNNKKNNDTHGPALTHELIHAIQLNEKGEVTHLPSHRDIRKLNLNANEKLKAVKRFKRTVYKHRGRDTSKRAGRLIASAEHGLTRWGHKALVLGTLGLIPKLTGMKDGIRDHIMRHNGNSTDIEQKRIETLMTLKGKSYNNTILEEYSKKTATEKLEDMLKIANSVPAVSGLIQKKFLSSIASLDKNKGTYEVYKDGKPVSHEGYKLQFISGDLPNQGDRTIFVHRGANGKLTVRIFDLNNEHETYVDLPKNIQDLINKKQNGNRFTKPSDQKVIAKLILDLKHIRSHNYLKINPNFKKKIFKDSHYLSKINELKVCDLLRSEADMLMEPKANTLMKKDGILVAANKISDYLKSSQLITAKKGSFSGSKTIDDKDKQKIISHLQSNQLKELQTTLNKYGLSLTRLGNNILNKKYARAARMIRSTGQEVTSSKISEVEIVRNALVRQANTLGISFQKSDIVSMYKSINKKMHLNTFGRAILNLQCARAAKKVVNCEITNYALDQVSKEGKKLPNSFELARHLASKFKDEQFSQALLEKLYIAIDHVLMFSAQKDALREMMVYSELSDAFEKTKTEFHYQEHGEHSHDHGHDHNHGHSHDHCCGHSH